MEITGSFENINGTEFYKIANSEKLAPFFIQVVSSSDIWIFLSSTGALTAGRKNAQGNIFPYITDDKLALDYETGSKTIIKANDKIWLPFEQYGVQKYNITRNIYKSCYANSVIMEEINHDLSLSYEYKYEASEKYGIIKTAKINNLAQKNISLNVVDGLMNIMPYGVNEQLQANSSTLVDAYKAAELQGDNLAVYSLTTTINDTPHPVEMLRANIAYTTAANAKVYLDPKVLQSFMNDRTIETDAECYGKKSGYFVVFEKQLISKGECEYSFVLDTGLDHCALTKIERFVQKGEFSAIKEDVESGTKKLVDIVSKADGMQKSGDKIACSTHYLNTLYNVMRGGTFENVYDFDYNLFYKFVAKRNKRALECEEILNELKTCETILELKEITKNNTLMYRMALEYMPLSFSRRHGDPARPWNKFNIALKDENGEKNVNYEGNWRDIFQNWEALGLSYPLYFENMVAKFVNATTVDGFNPYRINNDGIDWEKPEPENPFGGLGYWGDHQIIYLLRLLQGLSNHFPNTLKIMLSQEIFSYANVPYIIKDYAEILKDSKNTITFDVAKDEMIEKTVKSFGTDAKLLMKNSEIYTVCLAEKLLVPVLSKISNLMPSGGVWMNTQRPEWNDANNAIVGIGLSVITVYHIKAYLEFIKDVFKSSQDSFNISKEVVQWLIDLKNILESTTEYKNNEKTVLDNMGEAFCKYRKSVYKYGFSKKINLETKEILSFINEAIKVVDYTIEINRKSVFVSYNLLKDDFTFTPMKTMLEGQSAAIAGGFLTANEVCNLIHEMKTELYDEKEKYHTLYPVKKTTRFCDKNIVNSDMPLINGITTNSINGTMHFNADIVSKDILVKKCKDANVNKAQMQMLLDEFENVFRHKKFKGRSDRMYKFEGIGCVYWHQNAKFALGILETAQKSFLNCEDVTQIYNTYNDILSGFIYRKSPMQCNAIPIEPYSHTSYNKKSEQPGMTGQVKESIIMRRGELGVIVKNGEIIFSNDFLRDAEFDEKGEIEFSIYGIPCKYKKSDEKGVVVYCNNNGIRQQGYVIEKDICNKIFMRSTKIRNIEILI